MILIVDDSPLIRRMLTHVLHAEGHTDVLAPDTLAEARELLGFGQGTTDVEVVLLDLVMPEVDGLEFLAEIRAQSHLGELAVIIVTSLEEEQELQRAFEAGANDYLTKPPLPVVLSARVRNGQRLTRAMRARDEREQQLQAVTRELERTNARLEELSLTDQLTGLSNRRAFDLLLAREQGATLRTGTPLGLIMVDVDHFKKYNDHYGHPAGDECLRQVAGALRQAVHRSVDVVARYGGEEFALLLPMTPAAGVREVGEKARQAVENLQLPHAQHPLGYVTVSLGGVSLAGDRAAAVVEQADQALYQAKRDGRNRLVLLQEEEGED